MKPEFLFPQALSHRGLELGDGEAMEERRRVKGVVEQVMAAVYHMLHTHKWKPSLIEALPAVRNRVAYRRISFRAH